ncbi:protein pacG-like [Teratosphaeria destructans]|uniref:Protein pacG-like n=1 Tax=Teratosphaeria destructans TaxID=418781 RepID=A0A9W7SNA7_9PEZI|nr:protein pacG-like [Teratosphaeria destructans]
MDGLSGFDTTTMTYLATQMAQPNGGDNGGDVLLPLELQDYHSTFGYAGSDEPNLQSLQPQPTPQIQRLSSAYEDPFSDIVSHFDTAIPEQNEHETPSIERDNKLLSFSLPTVDYTLLDWSNRQTTISVSAQLHGMFFLAESPWAAAGEAQVPPPSELTCYRRNLFQITGEVALSRALRSVMTEQGEHIPIIAQELLVSATESTEGNHVKIISVPWKTPANPGMPLVEDKVEREPPPIPLDLMNGQEAGTDFATYPFQWKRLQFRIATANNGRRKELQQYFVVHLRVVATLATGAKIPICEVHSGAIIVRGRSPRNFQSRKDMPLNGSGNARKVAQLPGNQPMPPSRSGTGDSTKKTKPEGPTSTPMKPKPAPSMEDLFEHNEAQVSNDFYDWKGTGQAQSGPMTTVPPQTSSIEAGHIYAITSPDLGRQSSKPPPPPAAPINLSLVEDDSPVPGKSATPEQRSKKLHIHARAPSFGLLAINSPDESADLLYEYFPLGLDDWMPPVDAVYRPHVVHHTKLPSDPRDPKTGGKSARSKRLYSTDDVT